MLKASLNVVAFIMEGVAAIAIFFAGSFNIKNVATIIDRDGSSDRALDRVWFK